MKNNEESPNNMCDVDAGSGTSICSYRVRYCKYKYNSCERIRFGFGYEKEEKYKEVIEKKLKKLNE